EELETFFGAWSVGSDPDPSGLWRSTAEWNYGRWVSEESDELLDDGLSEDAFDDDYRKDVYVEWQQLFNEEYRVFHFGKTWIYTVKMNVSKMLSLVQMVHVI